jgi:hypothetical protein
MFHFSPPRRRGTKINGRVLLLMLCILCRANKLLRGFLLPISCCALFSSPSSSQLVAAKVNFLWYSRTHLSIFYDDVKQVFLLAAATKRLLCLEKDQRNARDESHGEIYDFII